MTSSTSTNHPDHACDKEGQATSNGVPSQWRGTGPHSMAREVLPYSRCEFVFPNVQTLAGKQDLKQKIAKLKLLMVGSPELTFYEHSSMKGQCLQ